MENENGREIKGWDGYITNFLKSDDVKENDWFAIVHVESVLGDRDDERLRLHLENSPNKYVFDLNKTNTVWLKEQRIGHPKELVGKKIQFRKVMVNNPQSKKEVESLRICGLE